MKEKVSPTQKGLRTLLILLFQIWLTKLVFDKVLVPSFEINTISYFQSFLLSITINFTKNDKRRFINK